MTVTDSTPQLLLLVAGAKGAVASTLAVATAALHQDPDLVLPSLTTGADFALPMACEAVSMAGWDRGPASMFDAASAQGVVPEAMLKCYRQDLEAMAIRPPAPEASLADQIRYLENDIEMFCAQFSGCRPVLINLLPAADDGGLSGCRDIDELLKTADPRRFPDLAYVLAAIGCHIPVVNFTPNAVELAPVIDAARNAGVPIAGRDGKSGQTFFKVVLASAFKARNLYVDGWYSLNILGNADGANLMDPRRAAGKLHNKTKLLEELLGYSVGERYGSPAHTVRIDYYPPRGDAKEAWDVIDFQGLFGLPMSLRVNLQGRDSILAAPMAMDLARWLIALQLAGHKGEVPELGFYFKKPVGAGAPISFQEQIGALEALRKKVNRSPQ
jgi:myo-inositol-1-phosphate synthase